MKALILSGVSGSGKSTYAKALVGNQLEPTALTDFIRSATNSGKCSTFYEKGVVVSADLYFQNGNEYKFDPAKLSNAHGKCFYDFINALRGGYTLVVVDNTNINIEEISPYILAAQAYGYDSEVVTFRADNLSALAARNIHGLTEYNINSQASRLVKRRLPWHWNTREIQVEGL